ncbi:MAG: hypothetical protein Q8896_10230 [Bacteroidota bacterium]|nr:hypothetical protein [Bacteroidota bacterium]
MDVHRIFQQQGIVKIRKAHRRISAFVCGFIILSSGSLYAQFSGSLTLGAYRSTNVEGRDSATPDNVFNPGLELSYNWDLSHPTSIRFEADLSPNFYTQVPDRSFWKSVIGATGSFYLSDIEEEETPSEKKQPGTGTAPPNSRLPLPIQKDSSKPVIIIKKAPPDIPKIASVKLALVSELMDSFEIDKKGLKADSAEIASDLKDSVSESILALSDILATEVYTESIAEVVADELSAQKKIFSEVPMQSSHKKDIMDYIDEVADLMKEGKPQTDILPVPKAPAEVESPTPISPDAPAAKNDLIAQALAHLQSESLESNVSGRANAPIITLINSRTEFNEFGSSDIAIKEDLFPLSKRTLATLLTVPISLETQTNKDTYKVYSYSIFEIKPRLDLYSGKTFGFGVQYGYSRTSFPYDTVYVGTENKIRIDSRIELAPSVALALEAGIGIRKYDNPLQYVIQIGKNTRTITTGSNFSHYILGGALLFFPANRLTLGVATEITRSSSLRPYILDLVTNRSSIGGSANDDEYSYELTRETFFSLWRIFWDINFALDISYENRQYANVEVPRRLQPKVQQSNVVRVDHGPQFGLNLSREFLFDSRFISVFNSFTPSLDIQSASVTSNVKTFNYKDVTTTLSFEFGF